MATKKQALERATYVILRGGADGTRDIFRGGVRPESLGGPAELKVEVERLDRAGVARVAQLGSVQAIARAMPMRLIAPVAKPKAARPVAGGMSWGIGAVGADVSAFNGHEAVVAVLDTGIDPAHPAFAGVNLVQKDFTGEGNGDNHGHGTHCAGTIFGRAVGGQRIGVAPGVAKALIGKVLGGHRRAGWVGAVSRRWDQHHIAPPAGLDRGGRRGSPSVLLVGERLGWLAHDHDRADSAVLPQHRYPSGRAAAADELYHLTD